MLPRGERNTTRCFCRCPRYILKHQPLIRASEFLRNLNHAFQIVFALLVAFFPPQSLQNRCRPAMIACSHFMSANSNSSFASRRKFLKTTGVAVAAAGAGPVLLPRSLFGADAPSKRVNMGFIGMGIQSRHLLGAFLGSDAARVLAVCDVDTKRRENAKKTVDQRYANAKQTTEPCAAYGDFRE